MMPKVTVADRDAVWSLRQIIVSKWQHWTLAFWSWALPSSSGNYTSFEGGLDLLPGLNRG